MPRTALLAAPLLLATLAAALLPKAGWAERTVLLPSTGPIGVLRLALPDPLTLTPFPVVLLLADGPDDVGRADPVVDRLLERGIAVIEANVEEGYPGDPDPAGLAEALEEAAPGWLAPARLGVLGFGAGARAALLWPAGVSVAALYPACAGTPIRVVAEGALVLHADDPTERAACARLPVRAAAVPGATHAWDHRHGPDEQATARLPHPDGVGARLFARRYPWAVEHAADRVAAHFARTLLPPAGAIAAPLGGLPVNGMQTGGTAVAERRDEVP